MFVSATAGWLLACLGCAGEIGEAVPSGAKASPSQGSQGQPAVDNPNSPNSPTSSRPPSPEPFTLVRETLRLLPFDTRLNRLALVLGVPASNRLFDDLRSKRLELGDKDVGKGVTTDPSWSPNRMALWIRLMRPICQSPALGARYPMLGADPSPLIAAAYGRPATATDLDAIRTGLAGVPDTRRSELSCLAVLSSAELVAR